MALRVIDAGLHTTLQDMGRWGHRSHGVPIGGAFDVVSHQLANALVGNDASAATLEMTLRGGTYEALVPLAVALAGAPMMTRWVRADGRSRVVAIPHSLSLGPGDQLVIGTAPIGARAYLAVAGGWTAPVVLGSRSREEPVQPGDTFLAAPSTTVSRFVLASDWERERATPLRVVAGPDAGTPPDEIATLWANTVYRVSARSDRMGLRLEGPERAFPSSPERLSTPVAPGAVQWVGGRPLVLGVACGTMGGYPHVAHLVATDLPRLAQLRPSDPACFELIPLEAARELDSKSRLAWKRNLARTRMMAADLLAPTP